MVNIFVPYSSREPFYFTVNELESLVLIVVTLWIKVHVVLLILKVQIHFYFFFYFKSFILSFPFFPYKFLMYYIKQSYCALENMKGQQEEIMC